MRTILPLFWQHTLWAHVRRCFTFTWWEQHTRRTMSKKSSRKRKQLADKVRKSRSTKQVKAPSAFDLRVNKQKHDILGRNHNARGQVGNPVQSRTKAFKQRSKTLLKELGQSKKSNVFKDMRLGETTDRLAMQRKTEHEMLNLDEEGEEEELTHRGQSITEIEQFNQPMDSDSDDDEDGRMGGKDNFGGFLSQKTPEEAHKSWKDRMSELISNTKKEKYERQSEKDKMQKKIEEVDAEFTHIHHLLINKKPKGADREKPKLDEYDLKVRMQQFEIKGTPSDKLKTEEEAAKEEAERLKKLEEDRVRRMKGQLAGQETTHESADSLGGWYSTSFTPPQDTNDKSDSEGDSDNKDNDDKDDDEDEDEDGSDDEDDNGDTDNSDLEDDNDDDDDDDDDDDEQDDDPEVEDETEKEVEALLKKKLPSKSSTVKGILKKTQSPALDLEEKKKIAEAAEKEIPYTFKAPKDLAGVVSILSPYSSTEDQVTVVERLVACHHPSLAEGNKQKLQLLFSLLIEYLMDVTEAANKDDPPVKLWDRLTPILWDLLRHDRDGGSKALTQIILHKHDHFQQMQCRKYMGLDTMLLLKLVHKLYPTSDFEHPVASPALFFITSMLGQVPVRTIKDVCSGLYLCALCADYVSQSKRYIPEVINFLHGVLFLASKKDKKQVEKVFLPFKPVGKFTDFLELNEKVDTLPDVSFQTALGSGQGLDTDEARVWCVDVCVGLLEEFSHLYSHQQASAIVFSPVRHMLTKLPRTRYPQCLKECVERLQQTLEKDAGRPMVALTKEKEKPKPLTLIEPRIEEVFDGRKKRKGTREQLERQRLQHKVKKEFKGALREIRRDNQFLAKQKLHDTKKRDAERQGKLKRIYSDLANQEGEVKALKRQRQTQQPDTK